MILKEPLTIFGRDYKKSYRRTFLAGLKEGKCSDTGVRKSGTLRQAKTEK